MPDRTTAETRPFGLLQLWDAVAGAVPTRECIVQGDRRLTWSEVADRTTRLGWWLTGQGLGPRPGPVADWESPGDLVGMLMRNCPEYLETGVGSYRARCAPFNVNHRYTAAELAALFGDARPSAVVYSRTFAAVLRDALDRAGLRPVLLIVEDGSDGEAVPGSVRYEDALLESVPPATPVEPSPDDVHVLFTGGTTGTPKGVLWRLRDLAGRPCGITVTSVEAAAEDAPRRGWLRALPAPPLMHGAAAWFANGAWSRGGTVVLSEDGGFDPDATWRLCRDERVTWLAIVGDAFGLPLVRSLRAGAQAPDTLTYVFSSGAVLSDPIRAELESRFPGLVLVNALGSSETGPQALQSAGGRADFQPGPHTVVVSDDHREVLGADRPGTGWLANGGDLPRGYLGDAERTAATFRVVAGRRLAVSGDRARVDADGRIHFLGRESSVVNTGGEKVYTEEVERALRRVPGVDDALVFGRPSEQWGQEVVALLVGDGELSREDLRAACADELAGYKVPRTVAWVPVIQRHSTGKVDLDWARAALDEALVGRA